MKNSISNDRPVMKALKEGGWVLSLILVLTAAIIAIGSRSIARDGNMMTYSPALQHDEALMLLDKNPELSTRRVFVRSKSLLVRAAVVEDKLLKRPEFKQLGFVITRDESDADLILELRHDLLTKYVFSVVEVKTGTVLVGGKLSSLGGTVAGKVAKRFVKEMAGATTP